MKFNKSSDVMWFFCWATTPQVPRRDYPTTICSFTRNEAIREVEKAFGGTKWRKLYRDGGRIVKCRLVPCNGGGGG